MKLIKWIFLLLLILIVLTVATVGIMVTRLDPNDYKPQIAATVKEKTGRDLQIPGEISWSLFPWLGLNLGETKMANAPGFSATDFAAIDEVDVHVELMPLIKKQVKVKKVTLRGLEINLEKNASGTDNWTDIQQATAADEAAAEQTGGSSLDKVTLSVEGVELADAHFTFKDRQANTDIKVGPVNLVMGALEFGKAVPVDMDVRMSMNNAMQLASKMKGEITLDPANQVLHIVSSLNADVSQQQEGVNLSSNIKGQLTADPFQGGYKVAGLTLDGKLVNPSFPEGLPLDLKADVDANTNTQKMSLKNLVMQVADLKMTGAMDVGKFIDDPTYQGSIKSENFSPRKVMQALGMVLPITKNDKALSDAGFDMQIAGNTRNVSIKPLTATLDDSSLQGEVSIADFTKQSVRFDLTLDAFNADDYLPPVTEAGAKEAGVKVADVEAAAAPATAQAAVNDTILLPVELIKGLDIDGTARLNQLIYNKLTFTDASLTLKANNGVINVAPLVASAYQGKANINANLNVTGQEPSYGLDFDLAGVRSEEILMVLFGEKHLSGSAAFKTNIKMSGNTITALKQSMSGQYETSFKEGTIHGSKLAAKLLEAQNAIRKLQGKPVIKDDTPDETEFSLMTASGPISNGILENDNLSITAPRFNVTGKGNVKFPLSEVDYTVRLAMAQEEGQQSYYLPLRVHGPFTDLSYTLKLDELAKQRLNVETDKLKAEAQAKLDAEKEAARQRLEEEKAKAEAQVEEKKEEVKQEIEEKKEELQEEIKDKLGDELGNALGGLFGRSKPQEEVEPMPEPAEPETEE